MKTLEMLSVLKKDMLIYEEMIERRGYLFPEDEGVRYAMLQYFEHILKSATPEDVNVNHIGWIKNKGIKLYK